MNWLKKIFLTGAIVVLSAVANFANAQGSVTISSSNYFTWVKVDEPACGKGSFYVYVNKYYNTADRLYYYEIYIWSDSYYKNCNTSYTYIEDVVLYVHDNGNYIKALTLDYFLAAPKTGTFNGWNYMAYVYSGSASQKFKIKWDSVSPY